MQIDGIWCGTPLLARLAACGGSGNTTATGQLNIAPTDGPVEKADSMVVAFTGIDLKPSGGPALPVVSMNESSRGMVDAATGTCSIGLLTLTGTNRKVVVSGDVDASCLLAAENYLAALPRTADSDDGIADDFDPDSMDPQDLSFIAERPAQTEIGTTTDGYLLPQVQRAPLDPQSCRRGCGKHGYAPAGIAAIYGRYRFTRQQGTVMRDIPIGRIMTANPATVSPDDPVTVAKELLESQAIHHLPVVSAGKLVGILSSADFLKLHIFRKHKDAFANVTVRDIMEAEPITLDTSADLFDVASKLIEGSFHALPVVEADGQLVGIVTSSDLIGHLLMQIPRRDAGQR